MFVIYRPSNEKKVKIYASNLKKVNQYLTIKLFYIIWKGIKR